MKYLYLGFVATLFLSCGNEAPKAVEETTEVCTYSYDDLSTKVNWNAFKFNEKTAVGGTFNEVNVLISQASEDMFKTLTGASFTIPTSGVNSNNEIRDPKIKASFFDQMESTEVISGVVKSINATDANVEITMNGVSKDYNGAVTVDGQKISFATTIDMNDFDAGYAIDSLNNVCSDLHKGADGVSKLWTEVEINVETTLKKDCK
ncbi:YceI family protein [Putridiphycobacter roseus]|uniref:YceI family protein n=1 Tax=Putridiphycobacter roseus TaxID=2219161 RepID=A0A2W1MV52_9FLAO|nr:YceI family protein [Putridiphycobacter roseus]PZE15697.1 YceI family protein [Putridiphycobacter roseus]